MTNKVSHQSNAGRVSQHVWGQLADRDILRFTLKNADMTVCVTDYGCTVTQILLPDCNGVMDDVVLGFDTLQPYLDGHPFFGATAGRFANRIKDGRFVLNGKSYQLETNEAATGQHLHGGVRGFDKYVWDSEIIEETFEGECAVGVQFSRVSEDGESGYPGTLTIKHKVLLTEQNALVFDYVATTDSDTIVNLVNHSYYNLRGAEHGTIESQSLQLFADSYTPVDANTMIPTGEIRSVVGTGLDFTRLTNMGENMDKMPHRGIDHNFCLRQVDDNGLRVAAILYDPETARKMAVSTNCPGIQCYNGFKLSNKTWIGKQGQQYANYHGLCFETQHYPDSPNQPHFPDCVLRTGETYHATTVHRFSWG